MTPHAEPTATPDAQVTQADRSWLEEQRMAGYEQGDHEAQRRIERITASLDARHRQQSATPSASGEAIETAEILTDLKRAIETGDERGWADADFINVANVVLSGRSTLFEALSPPATRDAEKEALMKLVSDLRDWKPRTGEDWPDHCGRLEPLITAAIGRLSAPTPASPQMEAVLREALQKIGENDFDGLPMLTSKGMQYVARQALAHIPTQQASRQTDGVREALELFRSFGCPVCNGDCGSANPPVAVCPMQVAQRALSAPPAPVEPKTLGEWVRSRLRPNTESGRTPVSEDGEPD